MRIDDSRPRDLDLETNVRAEPRSAARVPDAGVRRDFPETSSDRDPPELLAFYAGLRAEAASPTRADALGASRDAVAQGRMDAVRDAYAGPYSACGERVTARPMFRLNQGANEASMQAHARQLDAIASRVGCSGVMVRNGCASPRELVKVTQALIDAGKLPGGSGDAAARIRQMQWTWGIGVDCAGYTRRSFLAANGLSERQTAGLGLASLGNEAFRGLDKNPHFAKVAPSDMRPGDLVTLDPKPGGRWGHNLVVRSNTVADDAAKAAFAAQHGPLAKAFLQGFGPFHMIEVDSSWGAGATGADYGGFRRDTWIYDALDARVGLPRPDEPPGGVRRVEERPGLRRRLPRGLPREGGSMRRALFVLVCVALTLATPRARAGAIVPGAAPSREHRWGTVMVYGREIIDRTTLEQAIVGVEWDLQRRRVVRRIEVERMPFATGSMQATRIGDETYVVFGAACGDSQPALLYTLDASGHVLERTTLGDGCGPAIVANDAHLVVGLYEAETPILPPDRSTGWQPREAYHVRVFDRATRRIVGARIFRGDVLFAPKLGMTAQVLALRGARVFVSLPMIDKARIVAARLPSLVTEAQADLDVPREPEASASIASYDGGILALAGAWFELSDDLVVRKRRSLSEPPASFVAVEPHSERVFVDRAAPRGIAATVIGAELRAESMTWAWGRAVALDAAADGSGRAGILIVPR